MKVASRQFLPLALCVSLATIFFNIRPAYAKPKPSMRVTLVAHDIDAIGPLVVYRVFVILPDGSHAVASCDTFGPKECRVEPFAPEHRQSSPCYATSPKAQAMCEKDEVYGADRTINDLVIFGAIGPVTYHIDGTWDSFSPTYAPSSPSWTAICNDDTISYSAYRAGACSDHKGVRLWRVSQ